MPLSIALYNKDKEITGNFPVNTAVFKVIVLFKGKTKLKPFCFSDPVNLQNRSLQMRLRMQYEIYR